MATFLIHMLQLVSVEDDVNCLTAGMVMNGSSINTLCKLARKTKEKI